MTPSRRITIVLSSIAASLAGLGAAQMLGLGDGYRLLPASERAAEASALAALDRGVFKLPSWGDYAGVLAHPVFNETREPTPVDAVVAEDGAGSEPTAQPINVTLTSILITPKVKIAIVRDNNTGLSSVVKVGSALEGEQSGWKLVEVRPRGAVFEGQGLGRQDLELDVNTAAAAAGAPLPPGMAAPGSTPPVLATTTPEQPPDANNQVRAEEIRKRIEERRKQLREEAERMRSQEKTQ